MRLIALAGAYTLTGPRKLRCNLLAFLPFAFDTTATMTLRDRLQRWAKGLKRDGLTLWLACKHPATPWYAKALGVLVVAYALSPIDLIPDFIPVLGYLDDVLLLPGLIYLGIKLLPAHVLADCRQQADAWIATNAAKPSSRLGAMLIILVWVGVAVALGLWWVRSG